MAYDSLSSQQQELLDLLRNEIADYVGSEPRDLWDKPTRWQQYFESLNNQLEHLSRAAQMIGLQGFAISCDQLISIFRCAATLQEPPSLNFQQLITRWPNVFLGYLQGVLADGFNSAVSDELLNYLCLDQWPVKLTPHQKNILIKAFEVSDVIVDENSNNLYPIDITQEHACLAIPVDVHPELIDGLLTELPVQSESFFTAIDHYIHTHDTSYLLTAQRIAHTIKGAGNVVGISGVANLMHYCEDLLEIHQKGVDFGSANFSSLLQDVADCLVNITDFLQGFAPAPENIQSLLMLLVSILRDDAGESAIVLEETFNAQKQSENNLTHNVNKDLHHAISDHVSNEIVEGSVKNDNQKSPDLVDQALVDDFGLTEIFDVGTLKEIDSLMGSNASAEQELAIDSDSNLEHELKLNELSKPNKPQVLSDQPAVLDESAIVDDDDFLNASDIINTSKSQQDPLVVANASQIQSDREAKTQFNLTITDEKATELLRIVGETQISNTHIQSRVDSILGVVESTLRFQQQLLDLAAELDKSLAQQGSAFVATNAGDDSNMDPLEMERYHELHSFASRLQEVTTDAFETVQDTEQSLLNLQDVVTEQRRLGFQLQKQVLSIRLLPASILSSRFIRAVRQAARLTNKSAILDIVGDEVLVDSRVLNAIADPILHLLRNAVDHGLECSAAERLQSDKPIEGKITLGFFRTGDTIRITVSDDGQGINYQSIEKMAIERGIINAGEKHSKAELERIILMPGFSTRAMATQISGRGVGLDVVTDQVRKLKGHLSVASTQGCGTTFELSMPVSVLSAHLLMVTCAGQAYGILSRGLQQIAYLQPGELKQDNNQRWHYDYYGEDVCVFFLNHMLGTKTASQSNAQKYTALLITPKDDGNLCGIAVEQITASEEHIIKPLGRFTYRPDGVTGAAILGCGVIAPVLDIHDFPVLRFTEQEYQLWQDNADFLVPQKNQKVAAKPVALVADDSLSARRALGQFMADFGYEVIMARDGFDAINQMAELPEHKIPEVALLDLEMPRMNGLELSAHMRSQPAYQSIPIVMVTSRTTARHKLMAKTAGASAYLNKPWSDDALTQTLMDILPQPAQRLGAL